ncbi:hypothetical protein M0R45_006034 [Rubus argutus]|uniref:Uncharacterized protein n=1 Tax=Rubus argutus TaxID=59490 RepID=A0AAW1YPM1_RUBAR
MVKLRMKSTPAKAIEGGAAATALVAWLGRGEEMRRGSLREVELWSVTKARVLCDGNDDGSIGELRLGKFVLQEVVIGRGDCGDEAEAR